jgi:hypothetical protein
MDVCQGWRRGRAPDSTIEAGSFGTVVGCVRKMLIRSITVAGRRQSVPVGTITAHATTTESDQPLVADAPAVGKDQRAQFALGQCTQCRAIERRVGG